MQFNKINIPGVTPEPKEPEKTVVAETAVGEDAVGNGAVEDGVAVPAFDFKKFNLGSFIKSSGTPAGAGGGEDAVSSPIGSPVSSSIAIPVGDGVRDSGVPVVNVLNPMLDYDDDDVFDGSFGSTPSVVGDGGSVGSSIVNPFAGDYSVDDEPVGRGNFDVNPSIVIHDSVSDFVSGGVREGVLPDDFVSVLDDDSGASGSFGALLGSLLEDDEDDLFDGSFGGDSVGVTAGSVTVGGVESAVASDSFVGGTVRDEVVSGLEIGSNDDGVVAGGGLDVFDAGSFPRPKLSESDVENVERAQDLVRERRAKGHENARKRAEERVRPVVESREQTPARVETGVKFGSKSVPVEVVVDENGREVSVQELKKLAKIRGDSVQKFGGLENDPAVRGVNLYPDGTPRSRDDVQPWSARAKSGKQRYTYIREDGKINGNELEFFSRVNNARDRARLAEQLRGPVNREETEAERRERMTKIALAMGGDDFLKRGSKARVTQKDLETLQFLALFRYAKASHIGQMFGNAESTAVNRLKKLRSRGLVIDKKMYGAKPLWFLTEPGMILSGYDLPRITEGKLTYSMFPHQFGVNHVASNLWSAGLNVLNLPDYPGMNKRAEDGTLMPGEYLASELEIQSSFGRMRMFEKSDAYIPHIQGLIEREFDKWEDAGGVESGPSPEFLPGNEYMWTLYPPFNVGLAYHVPDLVIKRPRNADGTPASIAVEVELNPKKQESYDKTLRAYKFDDRLYSKVIWVCRSRALAAKLLETAQNLGLYQEGRFDVLPVITQDGVFKGRDVWTL